MSVEKANVLLIHGLLSNPLEMAYLGVQLEKHGLKTHYVFYPSIMKTLEENTQPIKEKIKDIGPVDTLHLVAHSLGGLLLAHLFEHGFEMPEGRILTLGSPIKGSVTAKELSKWPMTSDILAKSMPKALSGEGVPQWSSDRDWGMIAGTKNAGLGALIGGLPGESDGTVLLEETYHPSQKAHKTVDKTHTGLLFSKNVAKLTAKFLSTGAFD